MQISIPLKAKKKKSRIQSSERSIFQSTRKHPVWIMMCTWNLIPILLQLKNLGIRRWDGIFKVTKSKYQLRVLYKAKMPSTVRVQLVKLRKFHTQKSNFFPNKLHKNFFKQDNDNQMEAWRCKKEWTAERVNIWVKWIVILKWK